MCFFDRDSIVFLRVYKVSGDFHGHFRLRRPPAYLISFDFFYFFDFDILLFIQNQGPGLSKGGALDALERVSS